MTGRFAQAARVALRRGGPFGLIFLLLAAPSLGASEQTRLDEDVNVRMYTARLRIEPTRSSGAGRCLEIGLDDLEVLLRGRPVRDRQLLELLRDDADTAGGGPGGPRLHALLIDTSRSMSGHLDYVREAAAEYLKRLDPQRDRVLLATFDESVVLEQEPTRDIDRALQALGAIRMGMATSMLDGLAYVVRELEPYPDRPVVVLLTDGVDTASVHQRDDIRALIDLRPDLTVFTIGVALPAIRSIGPPGVNSTRRFLYRLATRTNGEFFDVPSGARLEQAYLRVRELLDNEASLSVLDPEPESPPGKLRVKSRDPGCRVELFRERERPPASPRRLPVEPADLGLPAHLALQPSEVLLELNDEQFRRHADPLCARGEQQRWFASVESGRVAGCALDVTMDYGLLYDPYKPRWIEGNQYPRLQTRSFEIALPAPEHVPRDPAVLLDSLSRHARLVRDQAPELDPRKRPAALHARPYTDYPGLVHGRTFFDLRPRLARALYLQPDYRRWTRERLQRDVRAAITDLKDRLRWRVPGASDEVLESIASSSEAGRRIRRRAERPSELDLQRYLAAWLGDVAAHDLFRRWEALWIARWLGGRNEADLQDFFEGWRELRRVFAVPSYARVLTLLSPVYDARSDRFGFYRVVLPRPGWLQARAAGWKKPSDLADLPLDLIPDRPLALWTVRRLIDDQPELGDRLRSGGYRVAQIEYHLLGKPRKQTPQRAFQEVAVRIDLEGSDADSGLRVEAELEVDRDREIVFRQLEAHAYAAADPAGPDRRRYPPVLSGDATAAAGLRSR